MSALPRPDLPPGPLRDLVADLHDLHHRDGWRSLRTLARATGVSHTTVSKAFSSGSLPRNADPSTCHLEFASPAVNTPKVMWVASCQ